MNRNKAFQEVNIANASHYINDQEALKQLKDTEQIFVVTDYREPESDKLIDLEVTIRKGKRIGVLK